MRIVNIGELKAKLSAHLQLVKNGEEVLVCDRNKPADLSGFDAKPL